MSKVEILALGTSIGSTLGWAVGYSWGRTRNHASKQHRYDRKGYICKDCGRTREFNEKNMYKSCNARLWTNG